MFNKYIPHIIILFLLIIISLITYIIISTDITKLFMTDVVKKENVSNTNNDKICLSLSEYNNLITKNKTTLEKSDIVEIRDRKVVSDQL